MTRKGRIQRLPSCTATHTRRGGGKTFRSTTKIVRVGGVHAFKLESRDLACNEDESFSRGNCAVGSEGLIGDWER